MSQTQLFGLFFKPVQVHRQLTDLLMQLGNQLLLILRARLPGLEQFGQVIPNRRPPLRDLRRMHRILSRQLRNRLKPHQGFESHFGLEGRTMPFAFRFHKSALSYLQQTDKSLSYHWSSFWGPPLKVQEIGCSAATLQEWLQSTQHHVVHHSEESDEIRFA